MSNQWHYSQDGAQYGPVDEAEIVRLIQDDELAPGTPVLKEGSMDWQPARNHVCFQVEIFPKKKASKPVATSTRSQPASGGTSQPTRRTTAQPAATPVSPAVTTVVVKEKSVLPWFVVGVAGLVLAGVLLFIERGSDTPQLAQKYFERGDNFYYGEGGESRDYAEAVKWYRKAALQGSATAQNYLGVMYANGYGVPEDDKEAVEWYRKAALQGNAYGLYNLGVMYDNGDGVPEDDKEAVEWYRKAALQGNGTAQANLGFMYANGEGVPQDLVTAYAWHNIAAANRITISQTGKAAVAKQLTPAQINQAQALSRTLSSQIRTP